MTRTTLTIDQTEEPDGTHQIQAKGVRNGRTFFLESFDARNDKPLNISLIDKMKVESRNPFESATATSLRKLLSDVNISKKTDGRYICERETELRFSFLGMITIRQFEELANITIDYSKFKTLYEFQRYFSGLMKSND